MSTTVLSAIDSPDAAAPAERGAGPRTREEAFRLHPSRVREDERGSMTLLCAMMVFLVTVFGVISLNTNQSIRHRIIAQNAADSAADSAALWQARGCNLLQQLNNLHYTVNRAAALAEKVAAGACITAAVLKVLENVPWPPVAVPARIARPFVCLVCIPLPLIDAAQQKFYEFLMPLQEAIVRVTPFLAFAYANANAKGSDADPVLETGLQYVAGLLGKVGISSIPGFGDLASAIPGGLKKVPLYAAPLDPTSLGLYVDRVPGKGAPWQFKSTVGDTGDAAGSFGCRDYGFPESRDAAESMGWNKKYGWNDDVYVGNPGFMTWVAGKTRYDELSGLAMKGFRWFNGEQLPVDEVSRVLYTDGLVAPGNPVDLLQIPAVVALASSQVEGEPVVPHGAVNATGKIIKVFIPTGRTSYKPGDTFFIYH